MVRSLSYRLGTLFAIASQSVSKGKGEGIYLRVLRFILHREIKNNVK